MKKLFLTSGLVVCMACPAFAQDITGPGNDPQNPNNECVENVLGVDEGNANIEAKWQANTYTVTYDKGQHAASGVNNFVDTDGATYDSDYVAKTGGGANAQASQTGIYADTGYTFQGWNTADNQTSANWTGATPWQSTTGLTVYAAYSANTNQISYATGTAGSRTTGFSGTMANTDATYDSSVTLRTNAYSIPGYEFTGWSSDVNLASGAAAASSYTDGQTINPYKVDDDVTLTAQWAPLHYTVTYNKGAHADTGVQNYVDSYNSQTGVGGATYDANYTALTAQATSISAADGYTFAGWTTDSTPTFTAGVLDNAWTGETPWTRTSALEVFAAYTANSYTISYNCGSAVSGSSSVNTGTVPESQTVYMDGAYQLAANSCEMNGYTFAGWSCPNLPGTPTMPANAQTPTNFSGGATGTYSYAGSITCTAQWTPNNIGLTWYNDSAENEGTAITVPAASQSCTYDGTIALPEDPEKTGYTFNGWKVRPTTQVQEP